MAALRCSALLPLRAARGAALPPLLPVTRAQPRAKRGEAQPGPAVPELCETWGRCSPAARRPPRPREGSRLPRPARRPLPDPAGRRAAAPSPGRSGPAVLSRPTDAGSGAARTRQPPSPFTARAHPSAASRAPPSPAPQGHPSADEASGDRRSPQPTPAPRSRSYLRRPEERRGAERPGARRRPLSPERRHAGSRAARRLPPAPGRCAALGGGAPSDLAGPRRAGKPRGGGQRLSPPCRGAGPGGAQPPRQGWGSPQRGEAGDAPGSAAAAGGARRCPQLRSGNPRGPKRESGRAELVTPGFASPQYRGTARAALTPLSERGCSARGSGTRPPPRSVPFVPVAPSWCSPKDTERPRPRLDAEGRTRPCVHLPQRQR